MRSKFQFEKPFTVRTMAMLNSPAFQSLGLIEHRILYRLEIEHMRKGGIMNSRLICSYGDFETYGMRRRLIADAIRCLEGLGFLEVMRKGRAGNAVYRYASIYRLTYLPTQDAGAIVPPTNEWRNVDTAEKAKTARIRAENSGGRTRLKDRLRHRKPRIIHFLGPESGPAEGPESDPAKDQKVNRLAKNPQNPRTRK